MIEKYDIIFGKEGEDDSFLLYKTLNIIHGYATKKKIRKVIFLWFCISAWKQWSDIIFFMKKTKCNLLEVKGEFRKEMRDKFNQAKNIGLTFQEALRTYHRQLAKEF